MGELVILAEHRADRSMPAVGIQPAFFFDLTCPFSYLAAERVERALGRVDWIPTPAAALHGGARWAHSRVVRRQAEQLAAELRLPLVWPERIRAEAPSAVRAATYAAEVGAGAQFALAGCRLAFCGGFDLEDPEILAEAAAAAAVALDDCLQAASDVSRDGALRATARGLRSRGVRALPAVRVGGTWFGGNRAVAEAGAMLRAERSVGRPLAPAG